MNIVVTGATKGIGKAIIEKFAKEGYNVYFCARTPQDVFELVERLQAAYPSQVIKGYAVDMSQKSALQSLAKDLIKAKISIDIFTINFLCILFSPVIIFRLLS